MNPTFINDMSWRMGEVYAAVTDQLLINLARHFKYIKDGAEIGGSWAYQVRKLAEMGQVTRESEAIIMSMLGDADAALQTILEESIRQGLKGVETPLKKASEKGLLLGRGFLPPEIAPNQMQAFRAYYRQSADKLNLVNTVMLESTQKAYQATVSDIVTRMSATQDILNVGTGEVVTGVSSMNQAVRQSVQKMVENGITGFIDHGGHKWSPEAYVTMDIRTTMANTAREAVFERNEQYGNDLYQVSWHDGARPLCYPWQGKVISRDNISREVTDDEGNPVHVYAQSETTYGEAAGLFGINCGHYPIPFIPGFSRIRPPEQNEKQNAKAYEESQKQRQLERKLREEKRDLSVLKAQGASDEEIKAQRLKVKNARDNLNDFCDETGRARRPNREQTPINATWPDESAAMATRRNTGWPSGDGGISEERLAQVRDYAQSKGVNIDVASFTHFEGSEETVRTVIDSVSDVSKDFPKLSDSRKGLIIQNAYNMPDGDYAEFRGRTLFINNNAFRNAKALEEDYASKVVDGLFAKGTTYKNIGNHEAGHAVVKLYGISRKDLVYGIERGSISLYDYKNDSERIGEAFSSYYARAGNLSAITIVQRALLYAGRR